MQIPFPDQYPDLPDEVCLSYAQYVERRHRSKLVDRYLGQETTGLLEESRFITVTSYMVHKSPERRVRQMAGIYPEVWWQYLDQPEVLNSFEVSFTAVCSKHDRGCQM